MRVVSCFAHNEAAHELVWYVPGSKEQLSRAHCFHIGRALAGHTLSASVGTLKPSLVSNLDLEDVQVSISNSSGDQLVAPALIAISSASEDLILVVPAAVTLVSSRPGWLWAWLHQHLSIDRQ